MKQVGYLLFLFTFLIVFIISGCGEQEVKKGAKENITQEKEISDDDMEKENIEESVQDFQQEENITQNFVENTEVMDKEILEEDSQQDNLEGNEILKEQEEQSVNMIEPTGTTLETRVLPPTGYTRLPAEEGSFQEYLRTYPLKEHHTPVLLYDGREKGNQNAHAAIFQLPLEEMDLQQCADSIMRMYAEYYWEKGEHEKIAFHFTNGFLCEYTKWKEGYRIALEGNDTFWMGGGAYDDSYESFMKYMQIVFSYAGTLSMDVYESEQITLEELQVGDVMIKGGSPGHVVMVVDVCENMSGEKAFLLAQGYMPAQEFHVLKNPRNPSNPWYYQSEFQFPFRTPEYSFGEESMIRRLIY